MDDDDPFGMIAPPEMLDHEVLPERRRVQQVSRESKLAQLEPIAESLARHIHRFAKNSGRTGSRGECQSPQKPW